ncbi:hypothetical protein ACHAQA_008433 [Verticillium albo-atrum]
MQPVAPAAGHAGSEFEAESMFEARSHADSESKTHRGSDADTSAKPDEYEVVEVESSEAEPEADQSTPKPDSQASARPRLPRLTSQSRSSSSFIGSDTSAQDYALQSPPASPPPPAQSSPDRPAQSQGGSSQDRPSQLKASQGEAQSSSSQDDTPKNNSAGRFESNLQGGPEQGGPSHINASREIPIPIRRGNINGNDHGEAPASVTDDDDDDDDTSSLSSSPTESIGSRSDDEYRQHTPRPTPVTRSSLKNKSDDEENPTIQIPRVTPLASGLTLPPNLAELAENLEDKYVDEFGNILEWDGRVLGRVEGDLPSMVGRPVAATGEIISSDGQVVGYVVENDTIAPRPPSPKPIHGMGEGMKVDHMGNILNKNNKIVGHFNAEELVDAPEPIRRAKSGGGGGGHNGCNCGRDRPKPTAAPSPSEIYLDVKSTNDGVQLIIKIPTVFNGGGTPNIHIGTSTG